MTELCYYLNAVSWIFTK